jgi:hypothetical protein
MYCRQCGNQLTDGTRYCPECGAPMEPQAGPAPSYTSAEPLVTVISPEQISPKSRLVVTLLAALPFSFFGIGGVHRFYLGKIGTGVAQLLTFGGLVVWQLIDFIQAVSGNMKDKEGRLIRDWKIQ